MKNKVYPFLTTCCRSVCLYITDYCRNVECRNGATCVNGETEYHCVCERGFTGRLCHVTSPTEIRDLIRVGMWQRPYILNVWRHKTIVILYSLMYVFMGNTQCFAIFLQSEQIPVGSQCENILLQYILDLVFCRYLCTTKHCCGERALLPYCGVWYLSCIRAGIL